MKKQNKSDLKTPLATAENFHLYNSSLKTNSRSLRKESTKSEIFLWKTMLKANQMKGYTFNRQRPVLTYIADFLCKELKLIIELDGITHHFPGAAEKDKIRQTKLEKARFRVIRFSDFEVFNETDLVFQKISNTILELEQVK
jgi:very-short-patch-repair endonuclease